MYYWIKILGVVGIVYIAMRFTLLYFTTLHMSSSTPSPYNNDVTDENTGDSILYKKTQIDKHSYKIHFTEHGEKLRYTKILDLLHHSASFRKLWIDSIDQSGFKGIFWECIPVTKSRIETLEFEFIVIESPMLAEVSADPLPFKENFSDLNIAVFPSLGKDAMLVVPKALPGVPQQAYTHMASFTREAPLEQKHQLWIQVAIQMRLVIQQKQEDIPIWLSTSGLGVYWLHVRLDTQPKYYNCIEYKYYTF